MMGFSVCLCRMWPSGIDATICLIWHVQNTVSRHCRRIFVFAAAKHTYTQSLIPSISRRGEGRGQATNNNRRQWFSRVNDNQPLTTLCSSGDAAVRKVFCESNNYTILVYKHSAMTTERNTQINFGQIIKYQHIERRSMICSWIKVFSSLYLLCLQSVWRDDKQARIPTKYT